MKTRWRVSLAAVLFVVAVVNVAVFADSNLEGEKPASSIARGWQYDWNLRTDVYGKPAGGFDQTPFPITEKTESYTISTDEGVKTFYLGKKFYVDGLTGSDANPGTSFDAPKKTIKAATIAARGRGNKTIIVRGAHDGFNGDYGRLLLRDSCGGVDDSHRFLIVGYGQERPIIRSSKDAGEVFGTEMVDTTDFVTLQRIEARDSARGVLIYFNQWFNLIDVKVENILSVGIDLLESRHVWAYHCSVSKVLNYGFGNMDALMPGCDGCLIDWCSVKDIGYWTGPAGSETAEPSVPGMKQIPAVFNSALPRSAVKFSNGYGGSSPSTIHGVGLTLRGTKERPLYDLTVRYSLVSGLRGGNIVSYARNFNIHHNEFYDCVHKADFEAEEKPGKAASVWLNDDSSGLFYANIVRDNHDTQSPNLVLLTKLNPVNLWSAGRQPLTNPWDVSEIRLLGVKVFNNLFYGVDYGAALAVEAEKDAWTTVNAYNNSIYGASSSPLVEMGSAGITGNCKLTFVNNVIYQGGSGKCADLSPVLAIDPYDALKAASKSAKNKVANPSPVVLHYSNAFYFPKGERGCETDQTEIDADPRWKTIPEGPYTADMCRPAEPVAGKDLTLNFENDFLGVLRQSWNMGAIEEPSR
jgi:hypothetical protein